MINRILSLLPFLLLYTIRLYAGPDDSIQASRYLEEASRFLERSDLQHADQKLHAALELYKKNERLDLWLDCHIPFAYSIADGLEKPFEAKKILEQALLSAWRQPKNPKEWEQWIRVQMNEGHLCQWYISDYTNAVKYYEVSFGLFVNKLGEKNDRIASYIYHQLGNAYTRLGDYDRAEKMLLRGIDYGNKNQNPEIGKYGDLAIVLLDLGKNKEALSVIEDGIKTAKMSPDATITARFSEARAWLKLKNPDQSRQSVQKALFLIAKLEGTAQEVAYYKAGYFAFLAELEDSLSNQNAEKYYKKAIEYEVIAQGSPFSREVGKARCNLAGFYLEQHHPGKALLEYQMALQSVIRGFKPKSTSDNPGKEFFYPENTIISALIGKSQAFLALNQPEKALECYELIPIVEAKLRATHVYESSSLLALKESRKRFEAAIDIAWLLFEQSNGNPAFAKRAFRLTELARGTLLLQSLVQAKQYLPEEIRNKDNELRVRMAWLEHEIAARLEAGDKPGSTHVSAWERELFDLKQVRQDLFSGYPSYNNPDSLFLEVLAAGDVQHLLRPGQAMVDYFLTKTAAYVFSMYAEGDFRWRKASISAQFRAQTKAFAGYLWAGDEIGRSDFLHFAWVLDSLLIAPERKLAGKAIQSLLVVPDDVLMLVPFEVLTSQVAAEGSTWRDQAWLLADYNVAYAYSATLLKVQQGISETHEKSASKPLYTFGGFAPSYKESSSYKLENTAEMAKSVRGLLGGKAWLGAESDEGTFKKTAASYRTLLLAMHGISDNEHPELSRLLFGDPGPDSLINNNILYASELQIMQLQADLVVLSACHSGSGKLEQGEGVYSLARAFAAAGVPASVMSLWLLHENTAPLLVEGFFKFLKLGKTKDEALRLAKLEFLKNNANFEMTHPFFWAGLTTAGDMRTLDLPQNVAFSITFYALLGVVAFVCFGFGWWWYRKRKP
jgi:tetratricopeptide (TPR) repeat protein